MLVLYHCVVIAKRVFLILCLPRACLLVRNGLVNKVEFLGLIPQKW